MAKLKGKAPYAVVSFFTAEGQPLGTYIEKEPQRYDTLKTRHNEMTMKGLNPTSTDASIGRVR